MRDGVQELSGERFGLSKPYRRRPSRFVDRLAWPSCWRWLTRFNKRSTLAPFATEQT
jgi:hypothetical protein